ncbi:MAG: hypothetical protein AAF737_06025 [Pseudomonadota bacterium]
MKTAAKATRPRPNNITRQAPRSRTAAASEMVRLEFERDRLMRDKAVMTDRMVVTDLTLGRVNTRISALQDMMRIEPANSKTAMKSGR